MKIAILSPIAWRTPPRHYGPWEQIASNITEELVKNGVDVTLFATGDSVTASKLAWTNEHPYAEQKAVDTKVEECLHISHLFERAAEFDLIHNHYDFLPLAWSRVVRTPMLTTIHGFSSPLIIPVYKKYNSNNDYVSISFANRHRELHYTANVYNGIDTDVFTFSPVHKGYLLFFGRIHPEKGTKEAIDIARLCGRQLIIAGLVQDSEYFNREVRPYIDDEKVIYAGNCGPEQRDRLLGNAMALLHPILFDEPFGLSVAEAMCCGTPVIAFNRGAMPELIVDGQTGFLTSNTEEAAAMVAQIDDISRAECRKRALTMFSKERMAREYIAVYKEILGR